MREPALLPLLLTTLEATATIAFALSGQMEAARKRLDAVCAFAGGWVLVGPRAVGLDFRARALNPLSPPPTRPVPSR